MPNETTLWLFGGVCFTLILLPMSVYLCFKAARLGYLKANKQFEDLKSSFERKGTDEPNETRKGKGNTTPDVG